MEWETDILGKIVKRPQTVIIHVYSIHCQRGVGEVDGEIFDFHPLVITDNL